jgi:hypothetical protein
MLSEFGNGQRPITAAPKQTAGKYNGTGRAVEDGASKKDVDDAYKGRE